MLQWFIKITTVKTTARVTHVGFADRTEAADDRAHASIPTVDAPIIGQCSAEC